MAESQTNHRVSATLGCMAVDEPPGAPSPLANLHYAERAHDIARFLDDPVDDAVAQVIHFAGALAADQLTALRLTLRENDAYTLFLFSRRRAAAALRKRSLSMALEAVVGLTL